jgi:hypothetical protein
MGQILPQIQSHLIFEMTVKTYNMKHTVLLSDSMAANYLQKEGGGVPVASKPAVAFLLKG